LSATPFYFKTGVTMKIDLSILISFIILFSSACLAGEQENREKFGFDENLLLVEMIDSNYSDNPYRVRSFFSFVDEKSGLLIDSYNADDRSYFSIYRTDDAGFNWEQKRVYADSSLVFLEAFEYLGNEDIYLKFGASTNNWIDNKAKFFKGSVISYKWDKGDIDTLSHAGTSEWGYDNMMVINRDTIFMLQSSRIFKTTFGGGYGGQYWEEYTPTLSPAPFVYKSIEKAKLDDTYFIYYLSLGDDSHKGGYYVARSDDYGQTWESYYWGKLSDEDYYYFEFLNKDTWYVSNNNHFKPDPYITISKTTNQFQTLDTIFCHRKYCDETPRFKIYGKNADKFLIHNTNRCFAVSTDGGQNFNYIINPDEVEETDILNIGFCEPDKILIHSVTTGYIMMYRPVTSIEDGEIDKFKTLIFPSPAILGSKIYISLENDKARTATCRIFDIKGSLIEESREIQIPKGYHTIDFRTDGYMSGAYLAVIESDGEIIAREKFIVE
jgi:hypothetical protein